MGAFEFDPTQVSSIYAETLITNDSQTIEKVCSGNTPHVFGSGKIAFLERCRSRNAAVEII